ncbi:hypothetical protein Fot_31477 [Forsythia ovata]|uniref:Uncharacterized protein n=1 Tax=Forsythia ovata TaxID=205694 RepID=A0ABD1T5G4_9LAMI
MSLAWLGTCKIDRGLDIRELEDGMEVDMDNNVEPMYVVEEPRDNVEDGEIISVDNNIEEQCSGIVGYAFNHGVVIEEIVEKPEVASYFQSYGKIVKEWKYIFSSNDYDKIFRQTLKKYLSTMMLIWEVDGVMLTMGIL